MSKERIAATFERLLQTTPYSKITVLMICKETPISRNAFYYNFAGKKEVAEWICVENYRSDCLPYHRIDSGLIGTNAFFSYIYKQKEFYRALFKADDGVLLHECLMKAHTFGTEEKYAREYGKIEKNGSEKISIDIYRSYAISGVVGVLTYWISTNYKLPLETMSFGLHMMLTEKLATVRDKYVY